MEHLSKKNKKRTNEYHKLAHTKAAAVEEHKQEAVEGLAAAGATRRRGGEGHDRSAGRTGSIGPRARGGRRTPQGGEGALRGGATEQGSWQSPFTG